MLCGISHYPPFFLCQLVFFLFLKSIEAAGDAGGGLGFFFDTFWPLPLLFSFFQLPITFPNFSIFHRHLSNPPFSRSQMG